MDFPELSLSQRVVNVERHTCGSHKSAPLVLSALINLVVAGEVSGFCRKILLETFFIFYQIEDPATFNIREVSTQDGGKTSLG